MDEILSHTYFFRYVLYIPYRLNSRIEWNARAKIKSWFMP